MKIDISSLVLKTIESVITEDGSLEKRKIKEIMKKIEDSLKDILETGELEIADFIYKTEDGNKRALEIKWRIRWNDSKTLKSHCFAFHRLKDMRFEPIMPIRRPKEESFTETIERFEKEGWKVLTGKETMDFILKETGFDLENWVKSNVNFWKILSAYKQCLEAFTLTARAR